MSLCSKSFRLDALHGIARRNLQCATDDGEEGCLPYYIHRAIINIVKNAAGADAKDIAVRWLIHRLYISNDGSPISPDHHSNLFIPFYTTKHHGSGIGLPLSRQVLMMQGYELSLSPVPQPGCHVTFVISETINQ